VPKYRLACLGLLLIVAGCSPNTASKQADRNGTSSIRIALAQRQPPITLSGHTLTNSLLSTKDLDGIVVINAWASWCRSCLFEWLDLQDVAKTHPQATFLGLNESDTRPAAKAFLQHHPASYDHLFDPDSRVFNAIPDLPSLSIPMTLVLDRKHRIAARIMGRVNRDDLSHIIDELSSE